LFDLLEHLTRRPTWTADQPAHQARQAAQSAHEYSKAIKSSPWMTTHLLTRTLDVLSSADVDDDLGSTSSSCDWDAESELS